MNVNSVLIVDDDPDMRIYLRGCLAALGPGVLRVMEAADGVDALRVVRSGRVQMVISDLVLPLLDGADLRRAIREDPIHAHIPVLLISGEDVRGGADGPIDGFLAKPFNARQLLLAVKRLLGVDGVPDPPDEGPDSPQLSETP